MNHRKAFIDTRIYYGIKNKSLHEQSGVSLDRISKFINNKTDVTTDVLNRLVDAMDRLKPGAKKYYCQLLYGKKFVNYEQLAEEASPEETAAFLKTVSNRIGTGLISSPELVS